MISLFVLAVEFPTRDHLTLFAETLTVKPQGELQIKMKMKNLGCLTPYHLPASSDYLKPP